MSIGVPFVLSSPLKFSAGVGAVGAPSDQSSLRTPSGQAILVEDIQVWIHGQSTAAVTQWHEWEIRLGRALLTDGFVPMRLCVRAEDSFCRYISPPQSDVNVALWQFPRPLYVPVGQTLQVKVRSGIASGSGTVAFRGRMLRDGESAEPSRIPVPYACVFRPPPVGTGAETDVNQYIYRSAASDLGNPFDAPLNVVRFVAAASNGAGGPGPEGDETMGHRQGAGMRYFPRIQLYHSNGAPILRDPTHLVEVCSTIRSEWAARFVLQPKDVIFATFDQTHSVAVDAAFQVGIGMIGWREVPISDVR